MLYQKCAILSDLFLFCICICTWFVGIDALKVETLILKDKICIHLQSRALRAWLQQRPEAHRLHQRHTHGKIGIRLVDVIKAPFTWDRIQIGSGPFVSDPLIEGRLHGIGSMWISRIL